MSPATCRRARGPRRPPKPASRSAKAPMSIVHPRRQGIVPWRESRFLRWSPNSRQRMPDRRPPVARQNPICEQWRDGGAGCALKKGVQGWACVAWTAIVQQIRTWRRGPWADLGHAHLARTSAPLKPRGVRSGGAVRRLRAAPRSHPCSTGGRLSAPARPWVPGRLRHCRPWRRRGSGFG